MTSASEQLDKIVVLWSSCHILHRDNQLQIGKALHEYVLAFLAEGDDLNECERLRRKLTRERATQIAADRLGALNHRINHLIRAAMTVELLSDGDLGTMPIRTIILFGRLVRRRREHIVKWSKNDNKPPSSVRETWSIVEGLENQVKQLFRKAVKEKWPFVKCLEAVHRLHPSSTTERIVEGPDKRTDCEETMDLITVARNSDPRDLAEMLTMAIRHNRDPELVIKLVLKELK